MTRATFGILGPLEIRVDGAVLPSQPLQLRRLLCILLLSPGRPVPAARVVEWMWPDEAPGSDGPDNPQRALRTYISRLRRILPDQVEGAGDGRGFCRLDAGEHEIDAGRFEALLGGAAMDDSAGAGHSASSLQAALALWRGPALLDCRDEPWAVGPAVRLDELRLVAVERLVDARLALGEHGNLCGELEELVTEHPLRERLWAQLMLAYYRAGRQADSLRAYQRLRARLGDDLGIEPSRELSALESQVLRHDSELDLGARVVVTPAAEPDRAEPADSMTSPPPAPRSNLPAQLTSFVGRERELAEVTALLETSRLVTLAGPGGVGKTRLACEVAAGVLGASSRGVVLAELSPLRAADIELHLASLLDLQPGPAGARGSIVNSLRDESLLLVLDNCEHVIGACAALCSAILAGCPSVAVIVTSREPLGLEGEIVYRVQPLGVPDPATPDPLSVGAEPAVQLFVDRARSHNRAFRLDAGNAGIVGSLCRQLDGIPLAIELAAARLRTLSLRQIHDLLSERFHVLIGSTRSRLPRHRTLRALVDWSYQLLEEPERRLLRSLSVFAGGFDLDALTGVLESGGDERWTVLENLTSLVDKSLVQADTACEPARYSLLETIREFAAAKLGEVEGEEALAQLRKAHASVFLGRAEASSLILVTRDQFDCLDALDRDFENFRSAMAHLVAHEESTEEAIRLVTGLSRFAYWRGRSHELAPAATKLMARLGDVEVADTVAARFLMGSSLSAQQPTLRTELLEALLPGVHRSGDLPLEAEVLNRLTFLYDVTGRTADARRAHESAVATARSSGSVAPLVSVLSGGGASPGELAEGIELARRAGDQLGAYVALCNLGSAALEAGDPAAARAYLEEALPIAERARPGAPATPSLLCNLAFAHVLDGDDEAALAFFVKVVDAARRQLDVPAIAYALMGMAMCAARRGDLILSATLYGAADEHLRREGFTGEETEVRILADERTRVRGALGDRAYAAATARGAGLSEVDAITLGSATSDSSRPLTAA